MQESAAATSVSPEPSVCWRRLVPRSRVAIQAAEARSSGNPDGPTPVVDVLLRSPWQQLELSVRS